MGCEDRVDSISDLQMCVDSREEEKKLDKARQTQQKLEEEMEAWRKRLLQHKRKVSEGVVYRFGKFCFGCPLCLYVYMWPFVRVSPF